MDLTDLRVLDDAHLEAALAVITADASRCQMEVHEWLNQMTGRRDFGQRFEHLAHAWRRKGKCRKDCLVPLEPRALVIRTKASA